MARANQGQPRKWLPTEAPLYYTKVAQFLLGDPGTPTGAIGAEASVDFSLNLRPDHVYGIRFQVFYALPNEFERENYDFRERMVSGGVDLGFSVEIDPTQTNVTADPTPAASLVGARGINWHPFVSPLLMRGGNNIKVRMRRLVAYPVIQFGDPVQDFVIAPTVHVTLATGQQLADLFPQGPPGSTGVPE